MQMEPLVANSLTRLFRRHVYGINVYTQSARIETISALHTPMTFQAETPLQAAAYLHYLANPDHPLFKREQSCGVTQPIHLIFNGSYRHSANNNKQYTVENALIFRFPDMHGRSQIIMSPDYCEKLFGPQTLSQMDGPPLASFLIALRKVTSFRNLDLTRMADTRPMLRLLDKEP